MNVSAISDMSSMDDSTREYLILSPIKCLKSPELPPMNELMPVTPLTALSAKPMRFSPPVSALKAQPAQRMNVSSNMRKHDVLSITDKMNIFDIGKRAKMNHSNHAIDEENVENQNGSFTQMKLIPMIPSKRMKYGSDKVLSPVRRSSRIQRKNENDGTPKVKAKTFQELLKESNYTFVPNSNLPKDH